MNVLKVVIDRNSMEILREEKLEEDAYSESLAFDNFATFIIENVDLEGVGNENNK